MVECTFYNPRILEMARINPGDWFEVTFRTLMGTLSDPTRALEVVTDARRCIPVVAFADICAFGGFRLEQILEDIRCPVVIVQGSEDWSVPPEFAREVERVLQKGKVPVEYIEWPSIGHFSQSECSEPFTRDTLAAMRRQSL